MQITDSAEQYWQVISAHVSSAVVALANVDEPTRGRIGAAVIANVSAYEKDGKIRIQASPAASWERNRHESRDICAIRPCQFGLPECRRSAFQ